LIKVLEIGGFSAGYFGRLFAQYGATVVRVDQGNSHCPWVSEKSNDAYLHANKYCVEAANPVQLSGLADEADVVVCEAETADELADLGFDEWATKIKVAITPFGRTGPKRNWQATPATLLAMGGYTHIIGDPERAPLTLPGYYVEFQTATMAFAAAAATFFSKQSDVIDISMLESVLSLTQFTSIRWHCAGQIRERHGNDFYFMVPSNLYRTSDSSWIYISIVPNFWDGFCVFLDRPELLVDPRFETNDLRIINREPLYELAGSIIGTLSVSECVERAERARIPFGVAQTLTEVLEDRHLAERDFWQPIEIEGESVRMPRGAYQMHGRAPTPARPQTLIAYHRFPGSGQ
jgi:crotonobetainyl-CoA:carnitine CoA-transferase CaiB-like acyl-CoA transferase